MDITRNVLKMANENKNEKLLKINVGQAMEYAKWLSYVPTFQQKYIDKLLEKRTEELSDIEIKQLQKFKEEQEMVPIFHRYISDECKSDDVLPVYDYMNHHSLDKLISSKLTEEELTQASKIIADVSAANHIELRDLVENWKEPKAYQALTMIHAYCFHILKKICTKKAENELQKEIQVTIHDSHPYTVNEFGNRQRLVRK